MNIAILGYGIEGKSARKFLKKKYPRATIEIRDITRQGKQYLEGLGYFDMIVRSPGIPYLTPEIQQAKKAGVIVTSATKLFFQYSPAAIVGITGTKGKGTVATMLHQILKRAGKEAHLIGNIGKPVLDILQKLKKNSIVIFELSSFQLQDLDRSPHIAVVLEIAPDHLDHHCSMKEYVGAKSNIVRYQSTKDLIFYFKDNEHSRAIAQKSKGNKIPITDTWRLSRHVDLRVPGEFSKRNASVAAAVAHTLGINATTIKNALLRFRGLPYHLELVREIHSVRYYNDSASTNPFSTKAALGAVSGPKILIMGGLDKGFRYSIFKRPIARNQVRAVVLFGANKNNIQSSIQGIKTPIFIAKNLSHALALAQKRAHTGDAIIFSPASASFDMFKNSKDRGMVFTKLVRGLAR